jgi:DNA ligase (NAD+)
MSRSEKFKSTLAALSLTQRKTLFEKARAQYYNETKTDLTDREFDVLEDAIRASDPDWKPLKKTGVRTFDTEGEVRLEEPMPSLDKVYPEDLEKHRRKVHAASWIVMDKLDGTSLQLTYSESLPIRLVTRGDGLLGRDVSFMIPALVSYGRIPKRIPDLERVVLRIEAVMASDVFERTWSRTAVGERGFDNARQCVNGLFLRKKPTRPLADVTFAVLGVYGTTLLGGLTGAAEQGFDTVFFFKMTDPSKLSEALALRRRKSKFAIDGLVFGPSSFVLTYKTNDRPKLLKAYKENDESGAAETTIERIIWQKTRLKRWQPKIKIAPTEMGGVVVEHATAHNPAWMMERGIGPGAIVRILRSGDVIPKIVGVVKKVEFEPPPGPYEQRGRFFYMTEFDETSEIRKIHFFLTTMGIELLALKSLTKLYTRFKTIESYVRIVYPEDFEDMARARMLQVAHTRFVKAGLGVNQSKKMLAEIVAGLRGPLSMRRLMVATGVFPMGMGEKKLAQLEEAGISMKQLGNTKDPAELKALIMGVKGFKDKTADTIVTGVQAFRSWYKPFAPHLKLDGELPIGDEPVWGPLSDKTVAFTGYRDAQHEQWVLDNGGQVTTFKANTSYLVYSPTGKKSNKVAAAGERALTFDQLKDKYK